MKKYEEFHGNIETKHIGKKLREIALVEKTDFKIITGYGSTSGTSKSKEAALRTLAKLKKEGMIEGYLPGDVFQMLITEKSPYYEDKQKYRNRVKNDSDFGNEGIIYIFK